MVLFRKDSLSLHRINAMFLHMYALLISEFTEEEKEKMRSLPRKEYLLDSTSQQQAFLGLVDILYAYAYNHRTTEGENTVESAWTMCKLSATLSWFEVLLLVQNISVL